MVVEHNVIDKNIHSNLHEIKFIKGEELCKALIGTSGPPNKYFKAIWIKDDK